jgi:DNA-binding HxlR family transcriptional regulator
VERVKHKAQILENRFSISVLLVLLDAGRPVIKGVLTSILSTGSRAVPDRIAELQDAGLVKEVSESEKPFRKFVELTPRGREIAEKLAEIEGILKR